MTLSVKQGNGQVGSIRGVGEMGLQLAITPANGCTELTKEKSVPSVDGIETVQNAQWPKPECRSKCQGKKPVSRKKQVPSSETRRLGGCLM